MSRVRLGQATRIQNCLSEKSSLLFRPQLATLLAVRPGLEFSICDEGDYPAAQAFLSEFLPAMGDFLAARLGVGLTESIHLALSDSEAHVRRFPARPGELIELLDRGEFEELELSHGDPEAVAREHYSRSSYAHAVATLVDVSHGAPAEAISGEPGIYLDVEALEALAGELDVLAMPAHDGS